LSNESLCGVAAPVRTIYGRAIRLRSRLGSDRSSKDTKSQLAVPLAIATGIVIPPSLH
jgi:hypothetical protein